MTAGATLRTAVLPFCADCGRSALADLPAVYQCPDHKAPVDGVVIGWVRPSHVSGDFSESLLNLQEYDQTHHGRLARGVGGFIRQTSGPNIAGARNELVRLFLANSTAPWLWMVDSDMSFDADILERLLEHADPIKAPVVGALCFSLGDDGMLQPTVFDLVGTEERPEFVRYTELPDDTMVECFATGAACVLIHRTVLEGVRDYRRPDGGVGFSEAFRWFQEIDFFGRVMSEDVSFCLRARTAGHPVHVYTGAVTGHVKHVLLDGARWHAQQRLIQRSREARDASTTEETS
jgi:hypothetical protein